MENKVNGNLSGIRSALLEEMTGLYDFRLISGEFANQELLEAMAHYTEKLGREISVYISRDGRIVDVSIGESSRVSMPDMRLVRNIDRLCGVRCIHTHPSGDSRPSGVDLGTLRSSMLDSMVSMGVSGGIPTSVYAAFLGEINETGERQCSVFGPLRHNKLPHKLLMDEILTVDAMLKSSTVTAEEFTEERALLVGFEDEEFDSLSELAELALTAGAIVLDKFPCRRRASIDNATYIGSGKAQELALRANELSCDLIIFDDELSAIQLRNLEQITHTRIIDRTTLILDIFAMRATSHEGKLQVELAQQRYLLPRLLGQGASMAKMRRGIGMRGPGEKKLELDRRRIRRRMFELEQEFAQIEKQRTLRRTKREKAALPLIALVGYTNAGKSTLINSLSGASEYVCDKLFATLDTVVRKVTLPSGTEALVSDTVGFINKLPHELVQAFRSTLEEVTCCDIIFHVVDSASPDAEVHINVVQDTLTALGATNIPQVLVLNKSDAEGSAPLLRSTALQAVSVSALNSTGLLELLKIADDILAEAKNCPEITVPYDKYDVLSFIRENGSIIEETHTDEGTVVKARLEAAIEGKVKHMLGIIEEKKEDFWNL